MSRGCVTGQCPSQGGDQGICGPLDCLELFTDMFWQIQSNICEQYGAQKKLLMFVYDVYDDHDFNSLVCCMFMKVAD